MFTKRERMIEQAEIELRQRALKSLVSRRERLFGESLDQRIKRAGKQGLWGSLSRAECRGLHRQEIAHLKGQLEGLHMESALARRELTTLKRAMRRAERARAADKRLDETRVSVLRTAAIGR